MVIHKDFDNFGEKNSAILEKIGAEIAGKIEDKKKTTQYYNIESKEASEKEIIREHIGAEIKRIGAENQKNNSNASNIVINDNDLPDYLKNQPEQIKITVEKLVEAAFRRGIDKAIAAALANPFSPFILKSFHDTLTDKLYDKLKEKKLI